MEITTLYFPDNCSIVSRQDLEIGVQFDGTVHSGETAENTTFGSQYGCGLH